MTKEWSSQDEINSYYSDVNVANKIENWDGKEDW